MEKRMTLAQLKRDAASGCLALEIVERFGKSGEEIPQRLRGIRSVTRCNSVALFLRNETGEESTLRLEYAKLVEYTGDELVIYSAGYRDVTPQEQAVLDAVKHIEEEYIDSYSGGYWQKKEYVRNSACPWMGYELCMIHGKKYDFSRKKVLDCAVRGNVILRYKVRWKEAA